MYPCIICVKLKTNQNNLLKTEMTISFHPKCSRNGRYPLTWASGAAPHFSLKNSETFVGYQAWLKPLMSPEKHWKDSPSLSAFKFKIKNTMKVKKSYKVLIFSYDCGDIFDIWTFLNLSKMLA